MANLKSKSKPAGQNKTVNESENRSSNLSIESSDEDSLSSSTQEDDKKDSIKIVDKNTEIRRNIQVDQPTQLESEDKLRSNTVK